MFQVMDVIYLITRIHFVTRVPKSSVDDTWHAAIIMVEKSGDWTLLILVSSKLTVTEIISLQSTLKAHCKLYQPTVKNKTTSKSARAV